MIKIISDSNVYQFEIIMPEKRAVKFLKYVRKQFMNFPDKDAYMKLQIINLNHAK